MEMVTVGTPLMWGGFIVFVVLMLAVDMFLLGRKGDHQVGAREAVGWSLFWLALALAFNALLWFYLDGQFGRDLANEKAMEFFTGYLLEKSLAMDNIFVFIMLFGYFAVPPEYQKRVLLYGVLGAIVMRAVMILLGAWLISQFHWVLYLFGFFLMATGIKMFLFAEQETDLAQNPALKWMKRHLRVSDRYHGEKFWIAENGVRVFTPLFLVLVLIEVTDLIFAVDSIPAIFAITEDPFIVFTSNIFAIMGLRALYFLLADMASRFHLLKYGLALVLVFVGVKMLIVEWFKIPVMVSLAVVFTLLGTSMLLSWLASRDKT
jgi:tellurite resistance protein TerC